MKINTKIKECLQQKEFKQYSIRLEDVEMELYSLQLTNFNSSISFLLRFASKVTNLYEEVLIFDDIGLIGSLGGSLGLFVGFSIFGYIITFLDVILDKCAELKNP